MRVNVFCSNIGTSFSKSLTQMVQGPQPNLKTIHSKLVTEYNQRNINNYGWGVICSQGYIYLRLVNTNGVPLRKLRPLVSDCSFPSLVGSSVLLEPEKGQNPLDLEPLPPIFSCSTLFSRVTGLPVVLQCDCTR